MTAPLAAKTLEDLKALSPERLCRVAADVRREIMETTSRCGGHVSPNLGAVELCIALLRVFSPPQDKVLFDVSHQTYAWKLLTGRAPLFGTLRQTGGISGFQRRSESPMDAFGAGHAGTAVSAAMGYAAAKRCGCGGIGSVVAVVGDAAAGNGVSLEAIDNLVENRLPVLVIVNDNASAASAGNGSQWRGMAEKFKLNRLKVDECLYGNDAATLEEFLKTYRTVSEPVLLRVLTVKGKGFAPAEQNPEVWHSSPPFDPATGARAHLQDGYLTWSEVFGRILCEEAAEDPRIFAITAAMTDGTGLADFARKYPDRFRDVGIREAHQMTFAAGLSAGGMKPVVAVYSTFFQRAWDNFVHDAALQGLPLMLALDRAGAVPGDGATHHGVFDIALLRPVPGVVIMQPRTAADLRTMIHTALRLEKPCAIRWPRGTVSVAGRRDEAASAKTGKIQIGKAVELSRTGNKPKAALWTLGPEDGFAAKVARILKASGVDSVHIDARFAKPIDRELLKKQVVGGVEVVFTWEDAVKTGGFGDGVREILDTLPNRPKLVSFGWPDEFLPHATNRDDLLEKCAITPEDAAAAILRALSDSMKQL